MNSDCGGEQRKEIANLSVLNMKGPSEDMADMVDGGHLLLYLYFYGKLSLLLRNSLNESKICLPLKLNIWE